MACGLTLQALLDKADAKCSGRLQFREILDCRPTGPRWICEPIVATRPVPSWGR